MALLGGRYREWTALEQMRRESEGFSKRGAKSTDSNPPNPPPPPRHPFSEMTHDSKKEGSGDRGGNTNMCWNLEVKEGAVRILFLPEPSINTTSRILI